VTECSHEHINENKHKSINHSNVPREIPDEFSENESFQCKLDVVENLDESEINIKIDVQSKKGSSQNIGKKFSEDRVSKKDSINNIYSLKSTNRTKDAKRRS